MALKKSIAKDHVTRSAKVAGATSAKSKVKNPGFITRLKEGLLSDLDRWDLAPKEVVATKVDGTKLYRVRIVASRFGKLGYSERQDMVWRALRKRFDDDTLMQISSIRTLTPSEAKSDG